MKAACQQHRDALLIAIQFLTRFPIHFATYPCQLTQAKAPLYYPLVGVLIGGVLACLAVYAPMSPMLTSAVLVVVWALMTGGLHLDGVADSADGWMAGIAQPNKILAVMKDPLIGASGALALILVVLLKFAVLFELLTQQRLLGVLIAPLVARTAVLLLLTTTPYVSPHGISAQSIQALPKRAAFALCGVLGALFCVFMPWVALCTFVTFWWLRRAMITRLGGMTGDTAGALIEITEVLFLLYFSII